MNPALENLEGRNLRLEAEVASLKAERHQLRASFNSVSSQTYLLKKNVELKVALDHAEGIAEMWKKDIQKYAQQWQVEESRTRGAESRITEMQRKHKAEMRTEKNLAHANGWAAGFRAAECTNTNTREIEEIKQMHRSELHEAEKALKAQHLRLRREDPMVYMVKLFRSNGDTAYMTRVSSHDLAARGLEHRNLRLFSSRKDANIACEVAVTGYPFSGNTYEVVEMPKHDIYSLPCYQHYHTHEAFQPLGSINA